MKHRREGRDLTWTTARQATRLILVGATARVSVKVALVVGAILSAANQGAALVNGSATWVTWTRVFVNFLVPYLVSSIGYLASFHVDTPNRDNADDSRSKRDP